MGCIGKEENTENQVVSNKLDIIVFESVDHNSYIDYLFSMGQFSFIGVEGVVKVAPVMKDAKLEERRIREGTFLDQDFQILSCLGKGGFSNVYLGKIRSFSKRSV